MRSDGRALVRTIRVSDADEPIDGARALRQSVPRKPRPIALDVGDEAPVAAAVVEEQLRRGKPKVPDRAPHARVELAVTSVLPADEDAGHVPAAPALSGSMCPRSRSSLSVYSSRQASSASRSRQRMVTPSP